MPNLRRSWVAEAALDAGLLVLCFLAAFRFRFGWPPPQVNYRAFALVAPVLVLANLIVSFAFGLYLPMRPDTSETAKSVVLAESLAFLAALAITFFLRAFALPRSVVMIAYALHLALHLVVRLNYVRLLQRRSSPRDTLLIASSDEAGAILQKITCQPGGQTSTIRVREAHALTPMNRDPDFLEADTVLVGMSVPKDRRAQILRSALGMGKRVQILPDLSDIAIAGAFHSSIGDVPVLEATPFTLSSRDQMVKRFIDILVAIPGLIVLLPLFGIVSLAVWVDSPGPVFFRQERVGRIGVPFTIVKFRTMVPDAERQTGPVMAINCDPRVTAVGRILRATRLDELPQIWNVIRGDMSLVGPRPERPVFVSAFEETMPDYHLRHAVAPGLTGLAQVLGRYDTSPEDKLRFDLTYIRQFSIWLDIRIMLLTLRVILIGSGSQTSDRSSTEIASISDGTANELAATRNECR